METKFIDIDQWVQDQLQRQDDRIKCVKMPEQWKKPCKVRLMCERDSWEEEE